MEVSIKETGAIQTSITTEEGQVDRNRKKEQDLLQECLSDDITLPLLEEYQGKVDPKDKSTDPATIINALDFTSVKKKETKTSKQYEKEDQEFRDEIQQIASDVNKLQPNLKAGEKLGAATDRLNQMEKEFDDTKEEVYKINERFKQVKKLRCQRFMTAFTKIEQSIDQIYKEITDSKSVKATLSLENQEEPYLGGIKYNAIPPHKRFREMDQLSGGEQALAALSLLFALQNFQPSPFFVLDEVDAALDPNNVSKVVNYIKKRSQEVQFLAISLKANFFERADALVGIYKEGSSSSKALTLDLTPYNED